MNVMAVIITVLGITASFALYRVIFGPTPWDRLIAVNLISSKVVIIMVATAVFFKRSIYMDVALVYAVIVITCSRVYWSKASIYRHYPMSPSYLSVWHHLHRLHRSQYP